MRNSTLDWVIWVLIYGGLLLVCLGIFVQRSADALGWTLFGLGAVLAVVGAGLVVLRSTREPEPGKGGDKS